MGQKGVEKKVWDAGKPNPKQMQFLKSTTMFTCYGGARGGGKTWIARKKAIGGALVNAGIKILMMRATFRELDENLITPICGEVLPLECCKYNDQKHRITFDNGSTIQFGNWAGEESERTYQGLEYDWIFIEEATNFTERAFNILGACLRGVNDFPKRMYLTCNPGGVGHNWVKRLFIDKRYRTDCENPEENETPEDYTFIFATVEDNTHLLESSPLYLRQLSNLPEDVRRAYRYGDWDAIGGNYFKEFSRRIHTVKGFNLPMHWRLYRSFDYGLDMFSCFWWAVDEDGRCWCIRHYEHKDLIVQDAAEQAIKNTFGNERILATYAPPDMWNRMKDTGKTMAELFVQNNLPIIRSDNNRVQGHMILKSMLAESEVKDPAVRKMFPERRQLPMLMFFECVGDRVFSDIESIQADDNNPNDCAKDPHDISHSVDGIRYFCIARSMAAESERMELWSREEDEEKDRSYDSVMTGGRISAGYMNF